MSSATRLLAEHVATPKFRAWLSSLFGAVALCLGMAGVYGVMAFVAGQRSKEIAVRMALGAGARSVLWTPADGEPRDRAVFEEIDEGDLQAHRVW